MSTNGVAVPEGPWCDCVPAVRRGGVRASRAIVKNPENAPKCMDEAVISRLDDWGESATVFAGVFDGHGAAGHNAAQFAGRAFVEELCRDPSYSHAVLADAEKSGMSSIFERLCAKVHARMGREMPGFSSSGTTACFSLLNLQSRKLVLVNLGDSKAVIACRTSKGRIQLAWESEMQREALPEGLSKKTVEKRSRLVLRFAPAGTSSELVRVSQCLGNDVLHDAGVSCVPACHQMDVSDDHCFLVLATDGVWDVMSPQQVVEFVDHILHKCRGGLTPAAALTLEALNRWKKRPGVERIDDVTAVIVPLPAYTDSSGSSEPSCCLPKILTGPVPQCNTEANSNDSQLVILNLPPADYFRVPFKEEEDRSDPLPVQPCLPRPSSKANPRRLIRSKSERMLRNPVNVTKDVINEDEPFPSGPRGLRGVAVPRMFTVNSVTPKAQPSDNKSEGKDAAPPSKAKSVQPSSAAVEKRNPTCPEPVPALPGPSSAPQELAILKTQSTPSQTIPWHTVQNSAWDKNHTAPEKTGLGADMGTSHESRRLAALMRRCVSEIDLRDEGRCHGASLFAGTSSSAPAAIAAPGASRAPSLSPVSSPSSVHTGFTQSSAPESGALPCLNLDPGTTAATSPVQRRDALPPPNPPTGRLAGSWAGALASSEGLSSGSWSPGAGGTGEGRVHRGSRALRSLHQVSVAANM